ncbi:MAG: hypothetical protein NW216_03945 [Hyphomicrobium sp.]|nr:hypothetical protein [Hyphomicrobium sp.]
MQRHAQFIAAALAVSVFTTAAVAGNSGAEKDTFWGDDKTRSLGNDDQQDKNAEGNRAEESSSETNTYNQKSTGDNNINVQGSGSTINIQR